MMSVCYDTGQEMTTVYITRGIGFSPYHINIVTCFMSSVTVLAALLLSLTFASAFRPEARSAAEVHPAFIKQIIGHNLFIVSTI
jgi:hypothetical protein